MDELIRLDKVTVRREGKKILRSISWATKPGEHWFVMGENGSGKTTLMEVLAGYQWPSTGKAMVAGGVFGRTSILELRKRVGYVSSWIFRRMPPETSVDDVVASGFEGSAGFLTRRTARVAKASRALLREFGCTRLAKREFGTLSSGEQLKVMLARALVNHPVILILDEPFAPLDVAARAGMYKELARLARQKDAPQIILVTHHFEDIRPFFTHGMFLKKGRVAAQGLRGKVLRPADLERALGLSRKATYSDPGSGRAS